jgi:hypothetical protein
MGGVPNKKNVAKTWGGKRKYLVVRDWPESDAKRCLGLGVSFLVVGRFEEPFPGQQDASRPNESVDDVQVSLCRSWNFGGL